MDFNLTDIKADKEEILEAMIRDDAINADISCLMDCYVDVELKYWKDTLCDYSDLQLPTDKSRPKTFSYKGADFGFSLDKLND